MAEDFDFNNMDMKFDQFKSVSSKSGIFKDFAKGVVVGAASKMLDYMPPVKSSAVSALEMATRIRDQAFITKQQFAKVKHHFKGVRTDVEKVLVDIKATKGLGAKLDIFNKGIKQTKKNLAYSIDKNAAEAFDFDKMFGEDTFEESSAAPNTTGPKPDNKVRQEQELNAMSMEQDGYHRGMSLGGLGKSIGGEAPPGYSVGIAGDQISELNVDNKKASSLTNDVILISNAKLISQQSIMFHQANIIGIQQHIEKVKLLTSISDTSQVIAKFNAEVLGPLTKQSTEYFNKIQAQLTNIDTYNKQSNKTPFTSMQEAAYKKSQEQKSISDFIGYDGGFKFDEAYNHVVNRSKEQSDLLGLSSIAEMKDMLPMLLMGGDVNIATSIGKLLGGAIASPFKRGANALSDAIGTAIPSLLAQGYDKLRTSENPILKSISEFLDLESGSKNTVRLSTVNRKATFDYVTRQSIVEVIPSYLSDIVSLLSGREKKVFDYKNGMFTTENVMKNRILGRIDQAGSGSLYENELAIKNSSDDRFKDSKEYEKDVQTILRNIEISKNLFNPNKLSAEQKTNPNEAKEYTAGIKNPESWEAFLEAFNKLDPIDKGKFNTNIIRGQKERNSELSREEINIKEYGLTNIVGSSVIDKQIEDLKRKKSSLELLMGYSGIPKEGSAEKTGLDISGTKKYLNLVNRNIEADLKISELESLKMAGGGGAYGIERIPRVATSGEGPLQKIYDLLLDGIIVFPKYTKELPDHIEDLRYFRENFGKSQRDELEQLQQLKKESENLARTQYQQRDEAIMAIKKNDDLTNIEKIEKLAGSGITDKVKSTIDGIVKSIFKTKDDEKTFTEKLKDNKLLQLGKKIRTKIDTGIDTLTDTLYRTSGPSGIDDLGESFKNLTKGFKDESENIDVDKFVKNIQGKFTRITESLQKNIDKFKDDKGDIDINAVEKAVHTSFEKITAPIFEKITTPINEVIEEFKKNNKGIDFSGISDIIKGINDFSVKDVLSQIKEDNKGIDYDKITEIFKVKGDTLSKSVEDIFSAFDKKDSNKITYNIKDTSGVVHNIKDTDTISIPIPEKKNPVKTENPISIQKERQTTAVKELDIASILEKISINVASIREKMYAADKIISKPVAIAKPSDVELSSDSERSTTEYNTQLDKILDTIRNIPIKKSKEKQKSSKKSSNTKTDTDLITSIKAATPTLIGPITPISPENIELKLPTKPIGRIKKPSKKSSSAKTDITPIENTEVSISPEDITPVNRIKKPSKKISNVKTNITPIENIEIIKPILPEDIESELPIKRTGRIRKSSKKDSNIEVVKPVTPTLIKPIENTEVSISREDITLELPIKSVKERIKKPSKKSSSAKTDITPIKHITPAKPEDSDIAVKPTLNKTPFADSKTIPNIIETSATQPKKTPPKIENSLLMNGLNDFISEISNKFDRIEQGTSDFTPNAEDLELLLKTKPKNVLIEDGEDIEPSEVINTLTKRIQKASKKDNIFQVFDQISDKFNISKKDVSKSPIKIENVIPQKPHVDSSIIHLTDIKPEVKKSYSDNVISYDDRISPSKTSNAVIAPQKLLLPFETTKIADETNIKPEKITPVATTIPKKPLSLSKVKENLNRIITKSKKAESLPKIAIETNVEKILKPEVSNELSKEIDISNEEITTKAKKAKVSKSKVLKPEVVAEALPEITEAPDKKTPKRKLSKPKIIKSEIIEKLSKETESPDEKILKRKLSKPKIVKSEIIKVLPEITEIIDKKPSKRKLSKPEVVESLPKSSEVLNEKTTTKPKIFKPEVVLEKLPEITEAPDKKIPKRKSSKHKIVKPEVVLESLSEATERTNEKTSNPDIIKDIFNKAINAESNIKDKTSKIFKSGKKYIKNKINEFIESKRVEVGDSGDDGITNSAPEYLNEFGKVGLSKSSQLFIKLAAKGKLGLIDRVRVFLTATMEKLNATLFGIKRNDKILKHGLIADVFQNSKKILNAAVDFLIGKEDGKRYGILYKIIAPAWTILENARHKLTDKLGIPFMQIGESVHKQAIWFMRDLGSNVKYIAKGVGEKVKDLGKIAKEKGTIAADKLKQYAKNIAEKNPHSKLAKIVGFGESLTNVATKGVGFVTKTLVKGQDKQMRKLVAQGKISQDEYDEWVKKSETRKDAELARHNAELEKINKYKGTLSVKRIKDAKLAKDIDSFENKIKKDEEVVNTMSFADMKADRSRAKAQAKYNTEKLARNERLTEEEQYNALTIDQRISKRRDDILKKVEAEVKRQEETLAKDTFELGQDQLEETTGIRKIVSNIAEFLFGKKYNISDEAIKENTEKLIQTEFESRKAYNEDRFSIPKENAGLEIFDKKQRKRKRKGSKTDFIQDDELYPKSKRSRKKSKRQLREEYENEYLSDVDVELVQGIKAYRNIQSLPKEVRKKVQEALSVLPKHIHKQVLSDIIDDLTKQSNEAYTEETFNTKLLNDTVKSKIQPSEMMINPEVKPVSSNIISQNPLDKITEFPYETTFKPKAIPSKYKIMKPLPKVINLTNETTPIFETTEIYNEKTPELKTPKSKVVNASPKIAVETKAKKVVKPEVIKVLPKETELLDEKILKRESSKPKIVKSKVITPLPEATKKSDETIAIKDKKLVKSEIIKVLPEITEIIDKKPSKRKLSKPEVVESLPKSSEVLNEKTTTKPKIVKPEVVLEKLPEITEAPDKKTPKRKLSKPKIIKPEVVLEKLPEITEAPDKKTPKRKSSKHKIVKPEVVEALPKETEFSDKKPSKRKSSKDKVLKTKVIEELSKATKLPDEAIADKVKTTKSTDETASIKELFNSTLHEEPITKIPSQKSPFIVSVPTEAVRSGSLKDMRKEKDRKKTETFLEKLYERVVDIAESNKEIFGEFDDKKGIVGKLKDSLKEIEKNSEDGGDGIEMPFGKGKGKGKGNIVKTIFNTVKGAAGVIAGASGLAITGRKLYTTAKTFKEDGPVDGIGQLTGLESTGDTQFKENGRRKSKLEQTADRFKAGRFIIRGGVKKSAKLIQKGAKLVASGFKGGRIDTTIQNTKKAASFIASNGKKAASFIANNGKKIAVQLPKALKVDKLVNNKIIKNAATASKNAVSGGNKLSKMLNTLLNLKVVKNVLKPKHAKTLITEITKKIAKSAIGRGLAASLKFLSGPIGITAMFATDFATGMADVRRFFKIGKEFKPSASMRVAAGLSNALNNLLLFGLVDMPWLVDKVFNVITMGNKHEREALTDAQNALQSRARLLGVDPDKLNELENKTLGTKFLNLFRSKESIELKEAKQLGFETVEEYRKFKESSEKFNKIAEEDPYRIPRAEKRYAMGTAVGKAMMEYGMYDAPFVSSESSPDTITIQETPNHNPKLEQPDAITAQSKQSEPFITATKPENIPTQKPNTVWNVENTVPLSKTAMTAAPAVIATPHTILSNTKNLPNIQILTNTNAALPQNPLETSTTTSNRKRNRFVNYSSAVPSAIVSAYAAATANKPSKVPNTQMPTDVTTQDNPIAYTKPRYNEGYIEYTTIERLANQNRIPGTVLADAQLVDSGINAELNDSSKIILTELNYGTRLRKSVKDQDSKNASFDNSLTTSPALGNFSIDSLNAKGIYLADHNTPINVTETTSSAETTKPTTVTRGPSNKAKAEAKAKKESKVPAVVTGTVSSTKTTKPTTTTRGPSNKAKANIESKAAVPLPLASSDSTGKSYNLRGQKTNKDENSTVSIGTLTPGATISSDRIANSFTSTDRDSSDTSVESQNNSIFNYLKDQNERIKEALDINKLIKHDELMNANLRKDNAAILTILKRMYRLQESTYLDETNMREYYKETYKPSRPNGLFTWLGGLFGRKDTSQTPTGGFGDYPQGDS